MAALQAYEPPARRVRVPQDQDQPEDQESAQEMGWQKGADEAEGHERQADRHRRHPQEAIKRRHDLSALTHLVREVGAG